MAYPIASRCFPRFRSRYTYGQGHDLARPIAPEQLNDSQIVILSAQECAVGRLETFTAVSRGEDLHVQFLRCLRQSFPDSFMDGVV